MRFPSEKPVLADMGRKQSQGRKASPAMTDRERLKAIQRKLRRMELVIKHPPRWVFKRFDNEGWPRVLLAQTMALGVIDRVRRAAGWE